MIVITRNTYTQQPLARLPNLFSVITVILPIMHGSILAVTIPPGEKKYPVREGFGALINTDLYISLIYVIDQWLWCLACKHAEQFGKMAYETLPETCKI